MITDLKLTGGCLCREIRYTIMGEPLAMGYCHCRSCQQSSGCGYYAWVLISCDQIKFDGEVKEFGIQGGSGKTVYRGFCAHCGSRLSSRGEWLGSRMTVSAGSLDNPTIFKPQMHLWTEEAQAWDCIDSQIQMYARGR